jgi:hypothetical protein
MNHANACAPPVVNRLGVLPWLPSVIIVGVGMAGPSGCEGPQSALDPAGRAAEQIARLFWKMASGTVLGLACYGRPDHLRDARSKDSHLPGPGRRASILI